MTFELRGMEYHRSRNSIRVTSQSTTNNLARSNRPYQKCK